MANKNVTGPVIMIEDDPDDQHLTKEVIRSLGFSNEIVFFDDCDSAFNYLITHLDIQPFIIISDVNLPGTTGLQFKERIDNTTVLRQKSIPFVFYSTAADKSSINKAYEFTVQGFFVKENSMEKLEKNMRLIFEYWMVCKHPNS